MPRKATFKQVADKPLEQAICDDSNEPKVKTVEEMAEDFCNCPNQNIIIIEQAENATKVTLEILNKLEPYNTDQRGDVQGCIWTLEGWLKNNLKHLKKAFE